MKPAADPRYAALTSGLLARKGEARPAMRSAAELTGEDLGWNDLGSTEPARQQAAIAERLALVREETAQDLPGRRAFTLRLDPERHLALRLACAVSGQSAQAFVTAALDAKLATVPAIAVPPQPRRARGRKD